MNSLAASRCISNRRWLLKWSVLLMFWSLFVISACAGRPTASSVSAHVCLPSDADTRPDVPALTSKIKTYFLEHQYTVSDIPSGLRATKPSVGATSNGRKAIVIEVVVTNQGGKTCCDVDSSTEPLMLAPSDRKYTPWEASATKELRDTTVAIIQMLPLEWDGSAP